MIPEEFEILMQAELDGENTPEESARLRAWLACSPEGRARSREFAAVFHALAQVERMEAPEDLRRSVLEAIAAEVREAPAASGWWEALAAGFARYPALRHAYPFALGVALGILAFAALARVLPAPPRDALPLAGTMMPLEEASRGTLVERRVLRAGQERFTAESWRAGDAIQLRLGGGPARGVEVTLDFDPRRLVAQGVDWSPSACERLAFAPGRLVLGFGDYAPATARFRATGQPDAQIRVTIRWARHSGEVMLRTGESTAARARP
jgi:hypothetical protein